MTVDVVIDSIQKLKEISKADINEFLSDWKLHATALWYLYTLIQGLLDLAGKLIAKRGFRKPKSYADYIYVLAENNIIPKEKINNFVEMARFRNVLAHAYANINLRLVYEFLQQNLQDADRLLKILIKELERS